MENCLYKLKIFKNGFTLAEVLITLVIVGVVAALTIPSVINKTKKQEYVSKLKKVYSTLSSATNKILYEEGNPNASIGGWATSSQKIFNQYKKYLNYTKECQANEDGCFGQIGWGFESGGDKDPSWGLPIFPKLILLDGVQVIFIQRSANCSSDFYGSSGICATIGVDVNGEKPPNIYGRDAFIFVLKEDGLYPVGCDSGRCSYPTIDCACRVIRENAMNY